MVRRNRESSRHEAHYSELLDTTHQHQSMNQYMKSKLSKSRMQVIDSESSSDYNSPSIPLAPHRTVKPKSHKAGYSQHSLIDDASSARTGKTDDTLTTKNPQQSYDGSSGPGSMIRKTNLQSQNSNMISLNSTNFSSDNSIKRLTSYVSNASTDVCLPLPASMLPNGKAIYGREKELEKLKTRLAEGGALTSIYGPWGIGKAHLAIHASKRWLEEKPLSRFVVWINAATEWTLRVSYLEALKKVLMGNLDFDGADEKNEDTDKGEIIIVAESLHRLLEKQRKKENAEEPQTGRQRRERKDLGINSEDRDDSESRGLSSCQVLTNDTQDWEADATSSNEDEGIAVPMDTTTLAHLLWDSLLKGVSEDYEWLVVFQNVPAGMGGVEGPAGLEPFFFPTGKTPNDEWLQGRILFTTRHRGLVGSTCLGPIHSLRIDRLEESAAVRMLIAHAVFDGDREMGRNNLASQWKEQIFQDAEKIAHKLVGPHYLDGAPLMISTAVGYIVSKELSLREYYSQLKHQVAVALEASGYGSGKVQSTVKRETSMSVCLEQAMDNAHARDLGGILSTAAFVCAENIPLKLLGGDEGRVRVLCDMNLLTEVADETYSMHRIHQRTALDAIITVNATNSAASFDGSERDEDEFLCTPDHAVMALRSAMSRFVASDASTWHDARCCIPHVEAIRYHHDLLERKKQLSPNFNHSFYAEIITCCASTLQWAMKDSHSAFSWFTEALRLQRRLFRLVPSSDTFSTGSNANVKADLAALLCKTLSSLGGLAVTPEEAFKYHKEALDIYRQTFGDNSKSIEFMTLYISMADVYERLQHYGSAYEHYKKALELYFTIYGHNQNIYADDQKMFLAETLQKIGYLTHHKMQKHAEAELYLEGAVSLLGQTIRGSNDKNQDLANAYETLGSICHAQGRLDEARKYYKNALNIKDSIHGDTQSTVISNNMYGAKYKNGSLNIGRSDDEVTSNESDSVPWGGTIGNVRLQAHQNFTNDDVYEDLELVPVSSEARKHASTIRDTKLARTLHRLGVMAWNLGSLQQAEDYFEKALSLQLSGYGVDAKNEDIAITLFSLGVLSNDLHNNQVKACSYYQKALDCFLSIHGHDANNESIAQLLHALGHSLLILKKPLEAKAYFKKALDMKYVLYGGKDKVNTDLVATLLDLGKVSRDLHADDEARKYFKSALRGLYDIHGQDAKNAEIALTLTQLGGLSYNLGLLDDAKNYFEKCLEVKYCLYGDDAVNDDLASTHNNLGSLHAKLKNYSEAFTFYELALDQYNKIKEQSGEEMDQDDIDSHRARTLHNLGLLSYNLKQFDKAEKYYAESLKIKGEVFKDVQDSPELALALTKLCSVETKRGKIELAKYYQDQALKRSRTFLENHQHLFNKDLLPSTPEETAALMALLPTDSNSEMKATLQAMDFWREEEKGESTKMCWLPFKGHSRKNGKKKSKELFRGR